MNVLTENIEHAVSAEVPEPSKDAALTAFYQPYALRQSKGAE